VVENGHTVGREGLDQSPLFLGDGLQAAHVGHVGAVDRGDDGDARFDQLGQVSDLIERVAGHLKDGHLVVGVERLQRDGQAKAVAQPWRIGENLVLGLQDGGDGPAGVGLASGASDANHLGTIFTQDVVGPVGQGELGVGDYHAGDGWIGRGKLAQHPANLILDSIGEVVVAVSVLGSDGDEKLARSDAARVIAEGRKLGRRRRAYPLPTGRFQ
jgi:hypothetical protein